MKKIGFLVLCFLQFSCNSRVVEKINGVSFVASGDSITQLHIDPVLKINANAAAIMPFGFIRDLRTPEIIFNTERQWFGETRAGAKQYIELLHKNNIKIMLKPQIWIWGGEFTGGLKMESEEDWNTLEKSYRNFIITYAELAEEVNCEVFCIGTELEQFVKHRPDFWKKLIVDVRKTYKGKLTYAANWDEYTRVPFWEDIDYIGIDAYFPLSEERHPTLEQLKEGWQPHKTKIKELSNTVERPVVFTEYGYRSMDYTAHKPWLVDRNKTAVNLDAQANATQAILNEFWNEDWFLGGYVWKWFVFHDKVGGIKDNRFTPQNKPAEQTLRTLYGK